ncbi:hypothetical protein P152DRAFT_337550 [Eremomyces bilateralis CBS 781.70]|uniref:Uncharacterized protein n=1 Tax=Eremomyces bilateralis CBS 781.70 TaxID=1392243 RepID=A0A6G1G4R6_9PEZI|nr:uncharacterized protein P152DRAFT_337550 [Eremomyces bilateralis CBS 781.70]KAF1813067.1 hypothetical protein P152DRAFT_337550 [Eremomyces bilateralis CBS 781.70]
MAGAAPTAGTAGWMGFCGFTGETECDLPCWIGEWRASSHRSPSRSRTRIWQWAASALRAVETSCRSRRMRRWRTVRRIVAVARMTRCWSLRTLGRVGHGRISGGVFERDSAWRWMRAWRIGPEMTAMPIRSGER